MINQVGVVLREKRIRWHRNNGVLVCNTNVEQGFDLAKEILYRIVDKKTVLYLSGGRTPKQFYATLAIEERLQPGAVGLVDERYGEKWHENSNEKVLRDTGVLRYYQYTSIPVYLLLKEGLSREETAREYDQEIRKLLATYQKHVALLGIGLDGHTAGLPAQNSKLKMQNSKIYTTNDLVAEYYDTGGTYGERITMTFMGLSMMDLLIVLVFGDDKREALELLFQNGSEEEIPARFFKRPLIASKTLLITDQKV